MHQAYNFNLLALCKTLLDPGDLLFKSEIKHSIFFAMPSIDTCFHAILDMGGINYAFQCIQYVESIRCFLCSYKIQHMT